MVGQLNQNVNGKWLGVLQAVSLLFSSLMSPPRDKAWKSTELREGVLLGASLAASRNSVQEEAITIMQS